MEHMSASEVVRLKRTPTETEAVMLLCCQAIDRNTEALHALQREVRAMNERDSWVESYRGDNHPNPFAELGEISHARARHYVEPDEGRE